VTVVFCDVTGSTAMGERLDPESLRRVMSRYFAEMRAALERHGGTVEKFIGDAVMAVFGVPAIHEDDALRAVRAAAEMREALEVLNKELERDHGVSLVVRIGVNTGEVVAGDQSDTLVTGDAVNVAARLEQAAEPGPSSSARRPSASSGTRWSPSRSRPSRSRASRSRLPRSDWSR
jgi:class 3 adenylate cyclase